MGKNFLYDRISLKVRSEGGQKGEEEEEGETFFPQWTQIMFMSNMMNRDMNFGGAR